MCFIYYYTLFLLNILLSLLLLLQRENQLLVTWLRTQFPDHTKGLLSSFKSYQVRLIASYHGVYHKDEVLNQLQTFEDLYTRVAYKVENGGMSLRCVQWVHVTAFLCSMAASLP